MVGFKSKLLLFSIIIAIVMVMLAIVLINLPPQQLICANNDGFCPNGCTFVNDNDCPKETFQQQGAIFSCLKDSDCMTMPTKCANEGCTYLDKECQYGTSCYVSINKNFENLWLASSPTCIGQEIARDCTQEIQNSRCIGGNCKLSS